MEENTIEESKAQATPKPEAAQPAPVAEQSAAELEVDKAPDTEDADEKANESELPREPWVTDPDAPTSYNWHWRAVIDGLMDRKPAYKAYADAYDTDISTEAGVRVAKANASRLLTNVNFKALWRKVLEEVGFNNETVDNELIKLMTDPTVHPSIRRAALRDFNELHGRIISRVDHTTKGKEIKAPVILSPIGPRDAGTETETV